MPRLPLLSFRLLRVFPFFTDTYDCVFSGGLRGGEGVCSTWGWLYPYAFIRIVCQFVCLLCFIDTFDLFQCMLDSFIMCARAWPAPPAACCLLQGHILAKFAAVMYTLIDTWNHHTAPRPPFWGSPVTATADVICWQMSNNNVTLSVHHNKIIRLEAGAQILCCNCWLPPSRAGACDRLAGHLIGWPVYGRQSFDLPRHPPG